MAKVVVDGTKENNSYNPNTNVNVKYNQTINKLKEWTKENFYFNNAVVHYLVPEGSQISPLPNGIKCDEAIYVKDRFDTPLSHLMYILICVGKSMEEDERRVALEELCKKEGYKQDFLE
jgi:hypothetical protein